MLTVFVLRHAKSSRSDAGSIADSDRPLAPRGRRAAARVAAWMREEGYIPDLIVCSPARRTRETCELVAPALGDDVAVRFDAALYLADAARLLQRLRATPKGTRAVLLIGHNPGLHEFAMRLAGSGDGDALARLKRKFPTAALAVLRFELHNWADIAENQGRLEAVIRPRDLA